LNTSQFEDSIINIYGVALIISTKWFQQTQYPIWIFQNLKTQL
jgi:hypothetical protein